MNKFQWYLWIGFAWPKLFRTWCDEYFVGITELNWMAYFPICNVISWNRVEQKTVKGYYSGDLDTLKKITPINNQKYKVLIEKVQKT